jgi:hypothetical protein
MENEMAFCLLSNITLSPLHPFLISVPLCG